MGKPIGEKRYLQNVRAVQDGDTPVIEGIAAVFDKPAEIWPGFTEVVRATAFNRALEQKSDVRGLYNHDWNYVLSRTKSGTLRLNVTDEGLKYEMQIDPEDTQAMSIWRKVKRGDVDGSSFWFEVVEEKVTNNDDDSIFRELLELKLYGVSAVTFPAYEETVAEARSAFQARNGEQREKEEPENRTDRTDKTDIVEANKETDPEKPRADEAETERASAQGSHAHRERRQRLAELRIRNAA